MKCIWLSHLIDELTEAKNGLITCLRLCTQCTIKGSSENHNRTKRMHVERQIDDN